MSQPNVHVQSGNSNICIGTDPQNVRDAGNIVVGFNKSESRSAGAPQDAVLQLRLSETSGATIISSGVLRGHEAGGEVDTTSGNTKVPSGCILLGQNAVIPTTGDGSPSAVNELILTGLANTEGIPVPSHGIPVWYNNTRYLLSAQQVNPPLP